MATVLRILGGRLGGLLLYLWSLGSIGVILWLIVGSLKSNNELFKSPWSIGSHLQWENFSAAWSGAGLAVGFVNSVIVVSIAVFGILLVSAPAAYVLTQVKFRGAEALNQFFIIGIGIPYQIILIPLYFLLAKIHLVNSLVGLTLIYIALSIPFTVFLLTGFMRSQSVELEEAAAIDGASPLRTFVSIVVPLSRSGLITAAILNAVSLWSEYMLALTFINDNSKYTLSLGLLSMYGTMQYTANWVGLFAGIVILILPMLLLYLWLNNRIIEGMTLGAGK